MAEQNTAKKGQVSEMNPRQTAEAVPHVPVSTVSVPHSRGPVPGGPGPDGPGSGAMLEGDLQAHIGRQLRAVYEEVVNEDVPDRFVKLLEELERKKAERS
jgi:Anti-sigma factor NepR